MLKIFLKSGDDILKFIKKLLIKNYSNTSSKEVRYRYGITAGVIGLVSNLLLFIAKLVIGILSCSITIIAEAINNLSDMGSCIIVLFGFKLSNKPADSEHPFGHARYEQIMALIVAVIVMAIGILLAKSSVEKLIANEAINISIATYIVLVLAILIKIFQMLVYRDFAKSINSEVLKASSIDSRNDCISTTAVLIGMVIIDLVGDIPFSIDGLFGILVSLFIIISSFKLIKETIDPLLGKMPDKKFVTELKNKILCYDGVLGIHDFMIHSYGADTYFATVHVEVPASANIMKAHDMIDNIERDFAQEYNISLSIHLDPIENNNIEVLKQREKIEKILYDYNPEFSFHDFRMVIGDTHTNILFDIVMPFDCKTTKEDLIKLLNDNYNQDEQKYFFIINIDRD